MQNELNMARTVLLLDDLRKTESFVTDKTGVRMVELIAPRITLDPEQPLLKFGDVRSTPAKYCMAELEWYLSQDLSIKEIGKAAKIWQHVACKDGFINSNYGWCIFSDDNGNQYKHTLKELLNQDSSRRAAMIYNRPEMWYDYNINGRSDWMCTFATQHMIRDNQLISIVNMRSNDLIYGFFNDFFWQAWVHAKLYNDLKRAYPDLGRGHIVWLANSMHVYERHFKMLEGMAEWLRKEKGVRRGREW
jgi:thymidylate synthase